MLRKTFKNGLWKTMLVSGLALTMLATGCSKPASTATKTDSNNAPKTWKPEKPVSLVVPMAAGGSTDLLARAVEKVWSKYCPQPISVVNKAGASGVDGSLFVSRAKPDGTTLLLGYGSGSPDLITPQVQKINYKPAEDIVPVARLSVHAVAIAVPADSEFKSMKDVADWAKKNNKPVTIAVSTTAGATDFVAKAMAKKAGFQVTPIPHKGGGEAVTTLLGSQTQLGAHHPSEIIAHVKSGKLRVIAVATPERDKIFPDVPTLKEQGYDITTFGSPKGIGAPKDTPQEIVDYYSDLFAKITADAEFKKAMDDMGQPVNYMNSKDFKAFFKQATDEYSKLIDELGFERAK
jgi:tripartite-type tricarboxylate transporter receptor subunit TctC